LVDVLSAFVAGSYVRGCALFCYEGQEFTAPFTEDLLITTFRSMRCDFLRAGSFGMAAAEPAVSFAVSAQTEAASAPNQKRKGSRFGGFFCVHF